MLNTYLPENQQDADSIFEVPEHAWNKSDVKCPMCQSTDTYDAKINDSVGDYTIIFECDTCGYSLEV